MVDRLRIHLFGGFLLEKGGLPLPPIASRHGRSIFAYLVMNRDRALPRDLLSGTFWPDLPESRARRRLSQALWQIQDAVNTDSDSHISVSSDSLAFDRSVPFWLDVAEFEKAVEVEPGHPEEHARLRRCVDLYRGDFLAGYFDDWVFVEQEHYRQKFIVTLQRLVDATKSIGSFEAALDYASRLTHHDPLNEEAHREVMRLNVLLGRTTRALEQYERIRAVVADELGTVPSVETTGMYEKILKQRRAGIHSVREGATNSVLDVNIEAPFVGRRQERRIVVDAIEETLGGSGGVVLIEGEAGIGKTRLAVEAAEDARWRGFEVTWGSCRPGAIRPFAPLADVLDSLQPLRVEQLTEQIEPIWLGEAARLVPTLSVQSEHGRPPELRPSEASSRMIEGLARILETLGRISPHAIIIDDVQWADLDTLSVLRHVGSRLEHSRVLIVMIYRSEEARGNVDVWETLRDLDRTCGRGRAVLSPLSVFELEELVRRILGTTRLDPKIASLLHRQTGGNALFTLETLLALRDRGLFETGKDPVRVLVEQIHDKAVPLAPRVKSIISARLSMLSPVVASVYELAAFIGDRIGVDLVEELIDLDRPTILHAIDDLMFRGLIQEESPGRYRLSHDQARQVIYEDTDTNRQVALHRRVAAAMAEMDPESVEAIGHHYRVAGDAEKATSYLLAAGRRSIDYNAYATARHHLSSARRMWEGNEVPAADRYEVLRHLEQVLEVLGVRDEQHEVIAEMLELAAFQPGYLGDVKRRQAWILAHESDFRGAEEHAVASIECERRTGTGSALASSLVALGTIRRWSGRPREAVGALDEAAQVGTEASDRALALTELASTFVELQQVDEALDTLAEVSLIYSSSDDVRGRAVVAGIQARALRIAGQKDAAVSCFQEAIELSRRIGYRYGEGLNLTNLANLHQLTGAVAESIIAYDRAAGIFARLGHKRGEAMVLVNSASARQSILGAYERAEVDANQALEYFAEIGDGARRAQCLEILAGIAQRNGELAEARQLLESGLQALRGVGNAALEGQQLRSLALLAIEEGGMERAIEMLDLAESHCAEYDLSSLATDVASIRALVEIRRGHDQHALSLAREASNSISPSAERAYLVHHRHSLVAEMAHSEVEAQTASVEAARLLARTLDALDPDVKQMAIERVPEHREILARARRYAPRKVTVQLPGAEIPTGRPLDDDDLLPVEWTVDHPDDQSIPGRVERRRHRVLRLLQEAHESGACPSAQSLAEALNVSQTTLRRDLRVLQAEGHDAHTRGQRHIAS